MNGGSAVNLQFSNVLAGNVSDFSSNLTKPICGKELDFVSTSSHLYNLLKHVTAMSVRKCIREKTVCKQITSYVFVYIYSYTNANQKAINIMLTFKSEEDWFCFFVLHFHL